MLMDSLVTLWRIAVDAITVVGLIVAVVILFTLASIPINIIVVAIARAING